MIGIGALDGRGGGGFEEAEDLIAGLESGKYEAGTGDGGVTAEGPPDKVLDRVDGTPGNG
ncbi:hypothetical protein PC116_g31967 [Phytophthora cactorum]|nr:hypothetical protein PC116_g31967 [Phytophthora cactorum]